MTEEPTASETARDSQPNSMFDANPEPVEGQDGIESRPRRNPEAELGSLMRILDATITDARQILDRIPEWKNIQLKSPHAWTTLLQATYSEPLNRELSPAAITTLQRLCFQWKARFRELRFLTSTRPTWNT